MVKKQMYHDIKKLQRLGYGKNRISRELGVDKRTVKKYWGMEEARYRQYMEKSQFCEKGFDGLRESILQLYHENENMRIPVSVVYDYFEETIGNLPANENSLRNYIRYLEKTGELVITEKKRYYNIVPELPYGKQLQIDFGVKKNHRGGRYYIFAAVLSASRFKYAGLQEKPFTVDDLIEHLLACFDYIGGIPEELVIDQDSIMVVDENAGDIIYTKAFGDFIKEMGIRMWVCRKADPESKGKIENFIKFIKNNFLAIRKFESLSEACESLLQWLERRANGKISQATKKIPGIEIEEERKHFKAIKHSIYQKNRSGDRVERVVSDKCRITVDGSYYDLPDIYRKQVVEIYKTDTTLFVFDRTSGKEIAEYPLSPIPGKVVKNKAIRREMGVRVHELKTEVMGYFASENWHLFLEYNFKAFERYARDQCLEARRYFRDREIDKKIFDQALEYCIENKTYSIANLNDSFIHFTNEQNKVNTEIYGERPVPISNSVVIIHAGLEVSKPDPSPYHSLIDAGGGAQ